MGSSWEQSSDRVESQAKLEGKPISSWWDGPFVCGYHLERQLHPSMVEPRGLSIARYQDVRDFVYDLRRLAKVKALAYVQRRKRFTGNLS